MKVLDANVNPEGKVLVMVVDHKDDAPSGHKDAEKREHHMGPLTGAGVVFDPDAAQANATQPEEAAAAKQP